MLIHYRALTFSVDMRLNKPQKICLERRAKELDDFSDPGIGSKSSYIGRQLFIFIFLKGLESPWRLRRWRVRLQYGRPRCTPGEESPGEATHMGMAAHCSILAWRIPWTEEPGGLQSMGSQIVWHDCALRALCFI